MTREELIGKVALIIFHNEFKECDSYETAEEILNTIFGALKEPTNEMKNAWNDDMSDWIDETIADPFHPWPCMLNASPLAKEGE